VAGKLSSLSLYSRSVMTGKNMLEGQLVPGKPVHPGLIIADKARRLFSLPHKY
jgi:hypothetical protein